MAEFLELIWYMGLRLLSIIFPGFNGNYVSINNLILRNNFYKLFFVLMFVPSVIYIFNRIRRIFN